MKSEIVYRCRNGFVLYRIVNKGTLGLVAIPDRAAEGKERRVVAFGPDVKDLAVGDVILVIGEPGQDMVQLTDEKDLWMTKEQNVAVVKEAVFSDDVGHKRLPVSHGDMG